MPYRILRKKGERWEKTFLKSGSEKELQILAQHINKLIPIGGKRIEVKVVELKDTTKKPKAKKTKKKAKKKSR